MQCRRRCISDAVICSLHKRHKLHKLGHWLGTEPGPNLSLYPPCPALSICGPRHSRSCTSEPECRTTTQSQFCAPQKALVHMT